MKRTPALLIGDPALRVHMQPPAGLHVYDLGTEWTAFTGHPMVYAVWAVRRSFAAAAPALVNVVYQAFRQSLAYSLTNVEAIAADAARWEPFPAGGAGGILPHLTVYVRPRVSSRTAGLRAARAGGGGT